MSYIDHITAFLFDENRRLSSKAAVVVFIVIGLITIDNIFGFSYHYNNDKKIDEIQKLNLILKDSTIDSTTRVFAANLKKEIIEQKSFISQTLSLFRGKSNNTIKASTNKPPVTPKQIDLAIKNNFWFKVTAGGIYFLLAIIMIPLMLFTDKTTSVPQRLATGIMTSISFVLFAMLFIWVLALIPQISNMTWIWNYIINLIIQILSISLLIYVGQQKK